MTSGRIRFLRLHVAGTAAGRAEAGCRRRLCRRTLRPLPAGAEPCAHAAGHPPRVVERRRGPAAAGGDRTPGRPLSGRRRPDLRLPHPAAAGGVLRRGKTAGDRTRPRGGDEHTRRHRRRAGRLAGRVGLYRHPEERDPVPLACGQHRQPGGHAARARKRCTSDSISSTGSY